MYFSRNICVNANVLEFAPVNKPAKPLNLELLFRALADRTRLRLLNLMGKDEVCVCYFVEILKTPQPKISRHLAECSKAGRNGREIGAVSLEAIRPPLWGFRNRDVVRQRRECEAFSFHAIHSGENDR